MSHRSRYTHELTASRAEPSEDASGEVQTDAYGTPLFTTDDPETDTTPVVEGEPVRFRPGGSEYVRSDTGERVARSPRVVGRSTLNSIEEGDSVVLQPIDDIGAPVRSLEVRSVKSVWGRSARSSTTTLTLEAV